MPSYTDQEVLAAFNSCLDLQKYRELPGVIQDRLCELFRAHRIKPVCFMSTCGLGLRVYIDAMNVLRSGDEVELTTAEYKGQSPAEKGRVDTSGSWLRCPPELYLKKEDFHILSQNGRLCVQIVEHDEDDDDQLEIVGDDKERYYEWKHNRAYATNITSRADADFIAKAVNGIVVKV